MSPGALTKGGYDVISNETIKTTSQIERRGFSDYNVSHTKPAIQHYG